MTKKGSLTACAIVFCPTDPEFTLIEIICVLVLLATLASFALARMVSLDQSASRQMLRSSLAELNNRENLTWCLVKLSPAGWVDDATLFAQVNTVLGPEYRWAAAPTTSGGGFASRTRRWRSCGRPQRPARPGCGRAAS
ncbi:MAG: type II secretion system GspH family protein [Desulfobacterales bacterium]|nr:type II secretion system GspH family protein [Desulfobacterales bacterium]